MSVLWFVLRLLLGLLGVLLALAVLALFIPVGAQVTYEKGALTVDARAAFLKLRVFPFKKREKPDKKKKLPKKKKSKKKKPVQAAPAEQPSEAQGQAAPPKKPAAGLPFELEITLATLRALAEAAAGMIRKILHGIHIHDICLRWPIQGPDAAETALRYGRVNALLHSALAALSNLMQVKVREVTLTPDFIGEIKDGEYFSCKITTRLFIMVTAGVWALYKVWRAGLFRKKKKEPEQTPAEEK